jgi:hypothetical protein
MAKKKKEVKVALPPIENAKALYVPPSFEVTFHAAEAIDFQAVSLLAIYYHSHNRMDLTSKFMEVADSFASYRRALDENAKP